MKTIKIELHPKYAKFMKDLREGIEAVYDVKTVKHHYDVHFEFKVDSEFCYLSRLLCWLEVEYTFKKPWIKKLTIESRY
jgi:hypothetical protein